MSLLRLLSTSRDIFYISSVLAIASLCNLYVDVGEDAKLPSTHTSTNDIDLMNINVGYMYQTTMNLENSINNIGKRNLGSFSRFIIYSLLLIKLRGNL